MEPPLQGTPTGVGGRTAVLRAALRNPSARRVLAAFFLFNTQEYGIWVAVVIYAYARGGATTAGLVLLSQLVPAMFFAPLASVLGDRMQRGRALLLGYSTQAMAAAALAAALAWAPPALAYLAAVISAALVSLTRPVHNAILPELSATPDELTAANAASGAMEAVGNLVGPLVISIVIGPGGVALGVGVMAVLMALAALLVVRLPLHARAQAASLTHRRIVADALEGARELRLERGATLLLLIGGSQFLLIGMLDVFYVMLAIDVLHAGESAAGLLASGFGAGGLLGAGVAVALVARRRLAPAMAAGLALCGVMLAALSSVTSVTPALALLALCGAGRSFFDVAARTLLQRSIRDEVLARVFGLQEALVMAGLAAGAVIAPFLVVALDEGPALLASGILFVGIGAVAARSLRVVDERAYVPGPELDVLRRVPFLRLLPRHVLEGLSRHAVRVTFPAGAVVIRQGDPGDSFYVVVAGEAAVIAAGVQVATPGPGDYFGEIALLHNVPRTATVAAVSELELLALERRHFLAAVTGSAAGAEQLAEVVDRRLGTHPGGWSGEGAPN